MLCYYLSMKNKKTLSQFTYKTQEESILIEHLSQSQLITKKQLIEIRESYNSHVPYHNFLHALKVAEWVLKLQRHSFNIIEIKSLFIAALFHDAGHTGTSRDLDEFRSVDIAFEWIINFEQKYNYSWIDYGIVRKSIIGTVFKNRAKNTDKYAILLADLDVSTVWMNFPEFLYYADFPFSIEMWVEISKWKKDVNYFKFLLWVNKNIYRSKQVLELYIHGLRNIRKYLEISDVIFKKLFDFYWKWDITFREFEEYYNTLIK